MNENKQFGEHNNWFFDHLTELLSRTLSFFTLIPFLFTAISPWPVLAADKTLLGGEKILFTKDEILEQSSVLVLESLGEGNKVAYMLVPLDLRIASSLGEGSVVTVIATAYTSSKGETDASPRITASGRETSGGTVAANFLPFGTKVKIGQEYYTVWDRMNSRYNGRYIIDLWFEDLEQARHHGIRQMTMEVVELP